MVFKTIALFKLQEVFSLVCSLLQQPVPLCQGPLLSAPSLRPTSCTLSSWLHGSTPFSPTQCGPCLAGLACSGIFSLLPPLTLEHHCYLTSFNGVAFAKESVLLSHLIVHIPEFVSALLEHSPSHILQILRQTCSRNQDLPVTCKADRHLQWTLKYYHLSLESSQHPAFLNVQGSVDAHRHVPALISYDCQLICHQASQALSLRCWLMQWLMTFQFSV